MNIDGDSTFGNIPENDLQFWLQAYTLKNSTGEFLVYDLAHFALKVYSLLFSNAKVEQVFSFGCFCEE